MKQYTIGFDFGSLSARGVLMDVDSGSAVCSAVFDYPHGIMTRQLPDGTPLPPDWALQEPKDYLQALPALTRRLLEQADAAPEQVIGLGLDTTACTMLPTTEDGTPLCRLPRYRSRPHAYVKLWKHHAAQPYTPAIEAAAGNEDWFAQFGSSISCEHYLPKVLQIAREDPDLYRDAARLIQMGDWLVWQLCGRETRGYCAAAFKTFYRPDGSGPDRAFLSRLDPLLADLDRKQPAPILHEGQTAGKLTEAAALRLGLTPGIAVSAAGVDAHVTLPGCILHRPGDLLLIIGTSTCAILNSDTYREIPGLNGVVPDGILPGLNAYEGGQACVGDLFGWFADRCAPASYLKQAEREGVSVHQYLAERAAALAPGQNGLVVLDWWNGVRSPLMDFDLSGLVMGLTLNTTPEELYRALLEATAYGARRIIDSMEAEGIRIGAVYAAGGIPRKNPLLPRIYADILGRDVHVVEQEHTGALGSAVLAAAAALYGDDGFTRLPELLRRYEQPNPTPCHPIPKHTEIYHRLYDLYCGLSRQFGGESSPMKELKTIRLGAIRKKS